MKSLGKRWFLLVLILLGTPVAGILWFNLFYVHQHCLPVTLMALNAYADNHGEHFPSSPKGFGDALALLIKEDLLIDARMLCAPGDYGAAYAQFLPSNSQESRDRTDIDENLCTRIYVQGLRKDAPGGIALIFDRYSTPGADHCRWPWGEPVREVGTHGGMITITDLDWPAFARNQIKLLVDQGFDKAEVQKLYLMTGLTMADLGQ